MDSAPVKANASLDSLCEKQPAAAPAPTLYVAGEPAAVPPLAQPVLSASPPHHVRRVATTHARYRRNASGPLGRTRPQARLLRHKTHYSPTDPEARIFSQAG